MHRNLAIPALSALLLTALPACSAAPAKGVPPVADEVDTVRPVEKPEPVTEEPIEEEVEEPTTTAPSCETASLIALEPVADSDPATVDIDGTPYTLIWSGDLNSDATEDMIVREEACEEGCTHITYVQCEDGYFEALRIDDTLGMSPLQGDAEWVGIQVAVPPQDDDEAATTEVYEWGETGYAKP